MKWLLTQDRTAMINANVEKIQSLHVMRTDECWSIRIDWDNVELAFLGTYHIKGDAEAIIKDIVTNLEFDGITSVPPCECDECRGNRDE